MVPEPWEAILLSLAAWRIFHLFAYDDLLDRQRRYVTDRLSETWEDFVTCVYCAGFWILTVWWIGWLIFDEWALVAATPWALHAGTIGAQKILGLEE